MRRQFVLLVTALAVLLSVVAVPAQAATAPRSAAAKDPFYAYDGSKPLSSFSPGAVLKTRTLDYHVFGFATPLKAIQLLYRSTDAQGRPSANVTTVLRNPNGNGTKALSYQSFYDSLNPEDGPSRAIAGDFGLGNLRLGNLIANAESLVAVPALLLGFDLILPDTEGQEANFAAGPEYGTNTLDSIRAATNSAATGLSSSTKVGLIGYSGGAIATGWAAALAPSYAPDVNKNLVGFAEGGVLVAPAHNLKYVSGSLVWTGVIPMAVAGIARSYNIDFTQYLNKYGQEVMAKAKSASIADMLGRYPGLTWKSVVKPEYANPNSVLPYVDAVNKVNLGSAPTPTVPGFIAQGNGGVLEGTFGNPPGIGTGDGVMVAGDVRTLARQYCDTGNKSIKYEQYDLLSHVGATVIWAPVAISWLLDRFAGKAAPSSCGQIPAGNSLAPEKPVSPTP